MIQAFVFQVFEKRNMPCQNFFLKKIVSESSDPTGGKRSSNVLHTNPTTLTMTATLSYTILLAAIYFVRKIIGLKPQNA